MSDPWRQALFLVVSSLVLAGIVINLARRRLVSLRYTFGWLAIAALGLLAAPLTPLVEPLADLLGMTPTALLLASATVVLVVITLQLSISVSGLQGTVRDLAESQALLARRLEEQQSSDEG